MVHIRPKPVVLTILDGWGENHSPEHNAIAAAKTPNWHYFTANYPHATINASELHVGLPEGQMGNSEVGHMNIGSGRVVMQDLPRIDAAIKDGSLAKNSRLVEFIAKLKQSGGDCHLMGLLSPGGVHAHQDHLAALANIIAAEGIRVWIHAFLDGRDTPPQSALEYAAKFENDIKAQPGIAIATISGRYFAMDRDKRWDRVEKAYRAIMAADAPAKTSMEASIQDSYANGKTDEFVTPIITGNYKGMQDGDGLLMGNFRADRAREMLEALLVPDFEGFNRGKIVRFAATLGMVEYSARLNPLISAIFPPEELNQLLGEIVASAGLTQLRIAETEKYAHVTFFFNGGREEVFPGEERILVPSPKVATYDEKPEMSAYELTEKLVAAIEADTFDLIVVNYANGDMVGHTGNIAAAAKAVEAVDTCLGKLYKAVSAKGGAMLITADHGNAEMMFDESTHQPHTAHTLNVVPLLLIAPELKGKHPQLPEGKLADIAPTVLDFLKLPKPAAMTGNSYLAMV